MLPSRRWWSRVVSRMLFRCAIRRERIIKAVATKHGLYCIATRKGGACNRIGWQLFSGGGCLDLLLICPLCDVCSQYERRGISVLLIYMPGWEVGAVYAVRGIVLVERSSSTEALKYRTVYGRKFWRSGGGDVGGCTRRWHQVGHPRTGGSS
jgi:hypothetical protein